MLMRCRWYMEVSANDVGRCTDATITLDVRRVYIDATAESWNLIQARAPSKQTATMK